MRSLLAALSLAALTAHVAMPALAQYNHDAGHNDYQSWASQKTGNCCSGRDCGVLHEAEQRETASGPTVLIDGQWCPVLREHYIIRGKSPDWNMPHACIGKSEHWQSRPPCERLLCYSGRGGV